MRKNASPEQARKGRHLQKPLNNVSSTSSARVVTLGTADPVPASSTRRHLLDCHPQPNVHDRRDHAQDRLARDQPQPGPNDEAMLSNVYLNFSAAMLRLCASIAP